MKNKIYKLLIEPLFLGLIILFIIPLAVTSFIYETLTEKNE